MHDERKLLTRLREVLRYQPRKGQFIWLIKRRSHGRLIQPGDVAGTKHAAQQN